MNQLNKKNALIPLMINSDMMVHFFCAIVDALAGGKGGLDSKQNNGWQNAFFSIETDSPFHPTIYD
jgi:hypothetical protein